MGKSFNAEVTYFLTSTLEEIESILKSKGNIPKETDGENFDKLLLSMKNDTINERDVNNNINSIRKIIKKIEMNTEKKNYTYIIKKQK